MNMANKLNIASLNVRGLKNVSKRKEIFNYARKKEFDIFCLQESHSDKNDEELWKKQSGGEMFFSHGKTNSKGVCILVSKKANVECVLHTADTEGRYVILEVKAQEKNFILASIYAPNEDNPEFFKKLLIDIKECQNSEIMLIGDFNMVMQPEIDRTENVRYSPLAFEILQEITDTLDIHDIWRICNPEKRIYSWTRKVGNKISGSRIDFTLVSQGLLNCTENVLYKSGYKTDHSLIELTLFTDTEKRGPGFWKFNNKLLYDKMFVTESNSIIENAILKYAHLNPADKWEVCKDEIIHEAQKRSRKLAKERKEVFNRLIQKIEEIEKQHKKSNANPIDENRYVAAKYQLEQYLEENTKRAAFRSRCQYMKDNEKNSKFFFSLEKSNYNKKTMRLLHGPSGEKITNMSAILDEQYKFYNELYTRDNEKRFTLQNNSGIRLSENDKTNLDAPVTLEEVTTAVKSLPSGKVPGADGLTAEFYQFFWSRIKVMYYAAINYAYEIGKLHLSARRGIISLIPKSNKLPYFLKNWRPLTMLSICYKILAKILATRLKTILPDIISDTQTGFMEGRQISSTIRTSIDISKMGSKAAGYILLLDFEKCFDRIEYSAITGAMRYFNIGENFIHWTELLLTDFYSCTTNNGIPSKYINVTRSCHQGCPLAPYQFLLCGEVLSQKIKENSNIRGITMNNLEHLIAQFADDTQLFLKNKKALEEACKTLTEIETNTGLKVNYEKSSIHCIGTAEPFICDKPLVWDPGGAVVLGIDLKKDHDLQYMEITEKAQKIANTWYYSWLTLTGKILIVNTLIASLYVYAMQTLNNPSPHVYEQIEKIVYKFLWKGKRAKIPMNLLKRPRDQGGLGLVDMRIKNSSLKIAWIFRNEQYVRTQIEAIIPEYMGELFWDCTMSKVDYCKNSDVKSFWIQIAAEWFELTWEQHRGQIDPEHIPNQIIWFNSFVKISGNTIYYKEWCKQGLMYISDLFDRNGNVYDYEQMQNKYGREISWLQYHALINAIPREWRMYVKNITTPTECKTTTLYSKIKLQKQIVKKIYKIKINDNDMEIRKAYKKFHKHVQVEFEQYYHAFIDIRKCTDITKYRDFQYRLLVNAIHTNNRLYYWGKVSSTTCEYCYKEKQTISHLMYTCEKVQKIWKKLVNFMEKCTEINVNELELNLENVFLNKLHAKPTHIVNFITLIVKQYIYCCKCSGIQLSFKALIGHIEKIYQMCRYNAQSSPSGNKTINKWAPYSGAKIENLQPTNT